MAAVARVPAYEPAPEGVCPAFQWIGQPFISCDRCGKPYWAHTHERRPAEGSGPFGSRWVHKYIPQQQRDAVRARWERS